MAQTVFNRYEKKYLMPQDLYAALRQELAPHMKVDQYGRHTICNIYYDTADDLLIRRSIDQPTYKEKLRLRSYGVPGPDSTVFLEIKKKYQKMVNKRRIPLTLAEAYDYLERGIRPQEEGQILREIDFFRRRYALLPRLYLAYDRVAMFGREDAQFRVTFDENIRFRRGGVGLERGDAGRLLLPEGYVLMESKVLGATPLWFAGILSGMGLYSTSFSKYGSIYRWEHHAWSVDAQLGHQLENWKQRREKVC